MINTTKNNMVVLSVFDGMSGGQIALNQCGIKYDKYYASEIDKYAMQITQKNYPNTIQLGDITKWREWNIEKPDLIIGGSPCQGFSFAGKRANFDDPRSKLFFEFAEIVKHYKPKYFLLENVIMDKQSENVISDIMGIDPIEINSALVSAQNRRRLYWTNIGAGYDMFNKMVPGISQPADEGILLKDILEDGSSKIGRMVGRRIDENGKRQDYDNSIKKKQRMEPRPDGALSTVEKDNYVIKTPNFNYKSQSNSYFHENEKFQSLCAGTNGYANGYVGIKRIATATDMKGHDYNKRIYSKYGKSPGLAAATGGNLEPKILDGMTYRKLTPLECERLQTVPDNYTEKGHTLRISNTQRYKMLGNGFNVRTIRHILNYMVFPAVKKNSYFS